MNRSGIEAAGAQALPSKSIWSMVGRILGFLMIAYYLVPRTPFRLIEPGWWLTYRLAPSSVESHYVAAGLFCAAVVAFMAFVAEKNRPIVKSDRLQVPAWLPVVVLFVPMLAALGSLQQNADIAPAICSVMLSYSTGILAALFAGSARSAVASLLVIVVIQSAFALCYRSMLGNVLLSGTLWREGGTFNDPNALSILAATGAALAFVMISFLSQAGKGLLYGVAAAAALAALISTWSRGGVVSLAVALVWFAIKYPPLKSVRLMVVVCLCLMVGLVAFKRSAGPVNSASAHQSAANRVVIWGQGVRELERHWFTGVGVGPLMVQINAPTDRSNGKLVAQVADGPKNVILYFMDELGVAGLVILGLAFICVRRMLAPAEGKADPEAAALAIAWLVMALYSLVDTTFGGAAQYCGNVIVGYLYGATLLLGKPRLLQTWNEPEGATVACGSSELVPLQ